MHKKLATLLLAFLLPAMAQTPPTVTGTPTNLESLEEGMISFRHQEHMWLTSDGAQHVLINQGMGIPSLNLYSSPGGITDWQLKVGLPNSNSGSSCDGFIRGNTLYLVYSSVGEADIRFLRLTYNPTTKAWSGNTLIQVYRATGFKTQRPTIAQDATGRFWVVFAVQNTTTNQSALQLVTSSNGTTWVNPGLALGSYNTSDKKSGRLVSLSDRMALIYSDDPTPQVPTSYNLNYAYRPNLAPINAGWISSLVYSFDSLTSEKDDKGSHFNVVADSRNNVHLIFRSNSQLIYSRLDGVTNLWEVPRTLTDPSVTILPYVQTSLDRAENLYFSYPAFDQAANYRFIQVLLSQDRGQTFTPFRNLIFNPTVLTGQARVETPSFVQSLLPVLQQYEPQINMSYGLVQFNLPLEP